MPRGVRSYDELGENERKLYDYMLDWLIEKISGNEDLANLLPPGVTFSNKLAERDRMRRYLLEFVKEGTLRLACDGENFWWEIRRETNEAWKVFGEPTWS